jgi:O-acetyl-ADP-ribose deacetylase (regulator of RNase III)
MFDINYVVSDVRTYEANDFETIIIPHCCNDLGAMGAGVAKALMDKWPDVYTMYSQMEMKLGNVQFVPVEYNNPMFDVPSKYVVNLIGQHNIRSKNEPKPIRYSALLDGFRGIHDYLTHHQIDNPVIHAPMLGSDLAGGSWQLIEELILETLSPHYTVTICCLSYDDIPRWRK